MRCNRGDHKWVDESVEAENRTGLGLEKLGERYSGGGHKNGEIGKYKTGGATCELCDAWRGPFGLEPTYQMFVDHMIVILREIRRVLRPDGILWLNLGDCYATGAGRAFSPGGGAQGEAFSHRGAQTPDPKNPYNGNPLYQPNRMPQPGLKPKDLSMIPARVALAAQADGWWLRSDIIWCLSGGTWLYTKTKKGEMPMMVHDMARLDPSTVKLWNGTKWTQVLGWNKSERRGNELELVLRSGERISCTPNHQWPTQRGLRKASKLLPGDVLERTKIPQPEKPRKLSSIGQEVAWFLGLYLAEGSRAQDTIQIEGHADEVYRIDRVRKIAESFCGTLTFTLLGNQLNIRVYSRVLNAIIDDHISGRCARDKGLKVRCWSYDNEWLESLLVGYLQGDGSYDEPNKRWRIGFARNYNWERDLRVLAARIGFTLTLNLATVTNQDGEFPSFRGEIRFDLSEHQNNKDREEIVAIRMSRCREVYDIGVQDDPHLFALASGILTHNSKPNPMPESVQDRPTDSYEHIFMLTKSERYFYDITAASEPAIHAGEVIKTNGNDGMDGGYDGNRTREGFRRGVTVGPTRNLRNVWKFATEPFSGAHFATFPTELPRRCILAGTSAKGACAQCGAPWERVTRRKFYGRWDHGEGNNNDQTKVNKQRTDTMGDAFYESYEAPTTIGWTPTCLCKGQRGKTVPCAVLDPFGGSGTTGRVAAELQRRAYLFDIAYHEGGYLDLAKKRTTNVQMTLRYL